MSESAVKGESVIWVDPERMNGTPCFRGTRVPFKYLTDYLEDGDSIEEFLTVTREQAIQALEEAKNALIAPIS
jgi:uncharacterized protein (DUF433 family)